MIEKTKKKIEFVCSGNHDRSPVAEMIAKQVLDAHNNFEYEVISSGLNVHNYQTGHLPLPEALDFIYKGRKWLSDTELERIEKLDAEDSEEIRDMFLIANDKMLSVAKQQKAEALWDLGYAPFGVKLIREQTVRRDDAEIILCMNQRQASILKKIYSGHHDINISPVDFDPVPDTYCSGVGAYKQMIRQLAKAVPESLSRISVI